MAARPLSCGCEIADHILAAQRGKASHKSAREIGQALGPFRAGFHFDDYRISQACGLFLDARAT
jgi:hypothetical protein